MGNAHSPASRHIDLLRADWLHTQRIGHIVPHTCISVDLAYTGVGELQFVCL